MCWAERWSANPLKLSGSRCLDEHAVLPHWKAALLIWGKEMSLGVRFVVSFLVDSKGELSGVW